MNKIYINNAVLASNTLLMKCISLMYLNKTYGDILFHNTLTKTLVKVKHNDGIDQIGLLTKKFYEKFIFNLKLRLNLNFLQKEHIHQASFPVKINDSLLSFRVSIHPSYSGENISLRIIRSDFFVESEVISNFCYDGLTLIGGKTTLYYSLIRKFKGNVISLEDPVEYPLYGINQTNVSVIGYEEGLKSILRQVPDLIGIGEIRDKLSVAAVFNTVLTGHSVISTIHFSNLNQLKHRLTQFGMNLNLGNQIIFMNNKKPELITNATERLLKE